MLVRISLILAILAGLAVGVLNFVKVKEKITILQTNLDIETKAHQEFEGKFKFTKSSLDKTNVILKQTIATLEDTTAEKEKAVKDFADVTKRADKLTEDLTKTRQERDTAQQELAAYRVSGMTPEQVAGVNKEYKKLQDFLAGTQEENKVLGKKVDRLQTELDRYKDPNKPIYLKASCKGKVLVTDPKWNFVVLDVGEDKGMKQYGQMLVNRNGKLVGKVVVGTVQKDRCIANVLPGWELGEVMEGDQVIPAYPET
jgi:flagellar biosynthesis chaperone FliJ